MFNIFTKVDTFLMLFYMTLDFGVYCACKSITML